jgi:hypothetical protein
MGFPTLTKNVRLWEPQRRHQEKAIIVVLIVNTLISCSGNHANRNTELRVEEGKLYTDFIYRPVFDLKLKYCRWCVPIPEGFICNQVSEKDEKSYNFIIFNEKGEEIRRKTVLNGNGPNDIEGIVSETVSLSPDNKSLTFIDGGYYYKEIDLTSLNVRTKCKITNNLSHYGSKYYIGRQGTTNYEVHGHLIITSFESTGFYDDDIYYLVESDLEFKNARQIASLKKDYPQWIKDQLTSREFIIDYYGRLRKSRIFTVDWKRNAVYCIPDIEEPLIEKVTFEGKINKLSIDIHSDAFKVGRDQFDSFCNWVLDSQPQILKNTLKMTCLTPQHAPSLQGIRVIDDKLLIITGKRDWNKGENEVLVYSLPEMKYEGCFNIPFPNAPFAQISWRDNYFSTYDIEPLDDDYISHHKIYLMTQ